MKGSKAKRRLRRRLKIYDEAVKARPLTEVEYFTKANKRPGSLKK